MSRVTNYILMFSLLEEKGNEEDVSCPVIDWINAELCKTIPHKTTPFRRMDNAAGGYKAMEICVFGYAANYQSPDEVLPILVTAPWKESDDVFVVIKEEDCRVMAYPFPIMEAIVKKQQGER